MNLMSTIESQKLLNLYEQMLMQQRCTNLPNNSQQSSPIGEAAQQAVAAAAAAASTSSTDNSYRAYMMNAAALTAAAAMAFPYPFINGTKFQQQLTIPYQKQQQQQQQTNGTQQNYSIDCMFNKSVPVVSQQVQQQEQSSSTPIPPSSYRVSLNCQFL